MFTVAKIMQTSVADIILYTVYNKHSMGRIFGSFQGLLPNCKCNTTCVVIFE